MYLPALEVLRSGCESAISCPETAPVMWRSEVERRPERHNPGGIDVAQPVVIHTLYVNHIDGLGHTRSLIEIAQIVGEVG